MASFTPLRTKVSVCVCLSLCVCLLYTTERLFRIPGPCHGCWEPVNTANVNRQASLLCVRLWLSYSVEVLARVSQEL